MKKSIKIIKIIQIKKNNDNNYKNSRYKLFFHIYINTLTGRKNLEVLMKLIYSFIYLIE